MDIKRDKKVAKIVAQLEKTAAGGVVRAEGTWGSFARLLVSHIAEKVNRPIVYICPHIDSADNASDDLYTFGCQKTKVFRAWEGELELADATDEIRSERLRVVTEVLDGQNNFVICAPVQALCQPIPDPKILEKSHLRLRRNFELSPESVTSWLVDNGFERVDRIDLPGQFARRGGIIDIYAPLVSNKSGVVEQKQPSQTEAIRIDFFGDIIEDIRSIDLDTQRSLEGIDSIDILSVTCGAGDEHGELFINILPEDTIIVFDEISQCQEVGEVYTARCEDSKNLYQWSDIYKQAANFAQLRIFGFASGYEDAINLDIKSVQKYQHKATAAWAGHKEAITELIAEATSGKNVILYCEASAEITRVSEIIKQINKDVPANMEMVTGYIHQGFLIDSLDTIVISHHEIFGQYSTLRRKPRPVRLSMPIDTLADLSAGDYVVHTSHGIGRYNGIKAIEEKSGIGEYLSIEYADGVKVQVSVRNIAMVQKYIGSSPKRPKLSKVGTKKWLKQKEKVAKSVEDLAGELLELQAKRKSLGGIEFGPDTAWQAEFEESFPYQETTDQLECAGQIKADMQQNISMDRLLCGDVGYGKTELSMRAAFKAVENSKQVAVLVPTTVLSVQHGRTFIERFADFPISIEVLNRFKTAKEANEIVQMARDGKVDILIGTHRLLSSDVGFADLGLLIIDEEQRFGVEHKEKLKKLRVNVDILTMTATPIPRTLHMALLGLRDISSLGTPPLDRRSIVTKVTRYNNDLIRKGIIQELNRQGQVFFLHNRVKSIDRKAWELRKLLEDTGARISVAHGQMSKRELEKAMIDFVTGQTDVLVCTTIIESGLDIPNANTIFIDNADRFGLAELHQLRGRVGRYKHRAYAYMLLPESRPITPIAAKRLKAIEEYSHLGAGFRIALRDLEIRGAGNILGAQQSGHIQEVGYQMYCEMLEHAVKRLQGEQIEPIPTTVVDIGASGSIPKNYIPSERHRLDVYRKIAVSRDIPRLDQIAEELADVYGDLPQEVETLLEIAKIRIKAGKSGIRSIIASGKNLVFEFDKSSSQKTNKLFSNIKAKISTPDPQTIYLQLSESYFEWPTLAAMLRKMFAIK